MNSVDEKSLVFVVSQRLRSFTVRAMIRNLASQYFMIPEDLSDREAVRVLRLALEQVEDEL